MLTSHLTTCHSDDCDADENDDEAPLKQFRRKKRRRKSGEENGVDENEVGDANATRQNGDSAKADVDTNEEKAVREETSEKNVSKNDARKIESVIVDELGSATENDANRITSSSGTDADAVKLTVDSEFETMLTVSESTSSEISVETKCSKIDESTVTSVDESVKIGNSESDVAAKSSDVESSSECVQKDVPVEEQISSDVSAFSESADIVIPATKTSQSDAVSETKDKSEMTKSDVVTDEMSDVASKPSSTCDNTISEVQKDDTQSKIDVRNIASNDASELTSSRVTAELSNVDSLAINEKSETPKSLRLRRNNNAKPTPTKSDGESERRRPERKCKTTTQALMKLTLSSEDFDFADDTDESSDDETDADGKSVDTNSVQNELMSSSSSSTVGDDKTETNSIQSKQEEVDSNSSRFVFN